MRPREFLSEAREAMATRFEIVLPGPDRVRLQAAADLALNEIDRLEAQLSMYRHSSEISGINALAGEQPVRVEPLLFEFLTLALRVSEVSEGAFDPTIGPLLQAWGLAGGTGAPGDPEAVEAARDLTGYEKVILDPETRTISFAREGMRLDLGAIGKGYAIDRAIELLREAGIESGLLHGGTSTVFGLGAPPEEPGWRVALRDPSRAEGASFGSVLLRDGALSVSAPHGKGFWRDGEFYGHVLDPRTGEPTTGALLAAVADPSATLTDALSTALLVLGPEGLSGLARRYPDTDFLVLAVEGERLDVYTAGPDRWKLDLENILPEAAEQENASTAAKTGE